MNNTLSAILSMLNNGQDVTIKANSNAHAEIFSLAEDYAKLAEAVALFNKNNWHNAGITHFDHLQKSLQRVNSHNATVNIYDLSSVAKQRRKNGEKI